MTRIGRIGRGWRRPDLSAPTHERARVRAAERLDDPLDPAEAAWLAEHLASCEPCQTVADAYEADRLALRGLRATTPDAPRDLWARTAAAIEREAARGSTSRRTSGQPVRRVPALGVLSGVAVIAVVVSATVLSGGFLGGPKTAVLDPGATIGPASPGALVPTPGPTPIVVGAGAVGWVGTTADGQFAYNVATVQEVCAHDRQPDCAPVADDASKRVTINARPRSIFQSPIQNQAVVVGTDAAGADAVLVIALPRTTPTTPTPTPTSSPTPATTPTTEPSPTTEPTPTARTSIEPTATPSVATLPPASETPTPSASANSSPEPPVSAMAIVTGVTVVGQSAAYSPDGAWFAFTARPADGSTGPDIYVWHVGDELASKVTDDHASVFASWVGGQMIGSRPSLGVTLDPPGETPPLSFFVDPVSGTETPIEGSLWRPVVDPSAHWSIAWEGTVKPASDGLTTVPATGSLVLRAYVADVGPDLSGASPAVVSSEVGPEFDIRWDDTGTWLAVWQADPVDPTIGRLSLLHFDPTTGLLDRPSGAPQDVAAMPGYSIADGRLAWATPPGQEGEGSRVQIVAWNAETVGRMESVPVDHLVVVH